MNCHQDYQGGRSGAYTGLLGVGAHYITRKFEAIIAIEEQKFFDLPDGTLSAEILSV